MRGGQYWANHFSTIGLVGLNEALVNLIGKDIVTPEGQSLAEETLVPMRERMASIRRRLEIFSILKQLRQKALHTDLRELTGKNILRLFLQMTMQ